MDPNTMFLFLILICLLVVSSGQVTVSPPVTVNPTPANSPVTVTPGASTPPAAGGQPVTSPSPTTPAVTPPSGSGGGGGNAAGGGRKWCVAKSGVAQTKVQVALDYACGTGKADCSAIQQSGSCYNPNTLQNHASYAFNSYFQKNPAQTSCDFGGAAVITTTNPSSGSCVFPTSSSASSPTTTTPPSTGAATPSGSGAGNSPAIMNGNGGAGSPGMGGVFPAGMGDNPGNTTTDTSESSGSLRPLIGLIIAVAVAGRMMNFGY